MRGIIKALAVATAVLSSAACTQNKSANSNEPFLLDQGQLDPRIISDRPIQRDKVILTIKLSSPALIEAAERTENGLQVPPEAMKQLMQEQEAVIAQLKSLSPDIAIVYRYRMILNGLAFTAPAALQKMITNIPGVRSVEPARKIGRPITSALASADKKSKPFSRTSVQFIEADQVHRELKTSEGLAVRGQGMRVGVLDTGIDFTHRMLGGNGREEDFKNTKPSDATAAFPNNKVVGGLDLVGTEFDAGSELWSKQLPKPDTNPIDEGGHGTHVAGTIAGIGDGLETYSGVAPDAQLYAIKVFGADGSTSDSVVIAGLEYAADPNQDGDPSDRLDVVNLSLGSGFGQPQIMYTEAIRVLSEGGTMVVASAGNSGAIDYVVGAPSTSDEALSVAASIDDMDHNWKFNASEIKIGNSDAFLVRAIEGPISKPVEESAGVKGKLVHIGLANRPLTDEEKAKLSGNIALIDRGAVAFVEKLKVAKSGGAIGALVANNQPGEPIPMGGDGSVDIPAIMVTKEVGDQVKEGVSKGDVVLDFNTGKMIEDATLVDTITDFSSKGPRSMDSALKPEITAPGQSIISASMGSGDKGVEMSGTSMSGPHMAGVMTLVKQFRPKLSTRELKSLVMSTTKSIHDAKGVVYPLTLQGAGRVRTMAAVMAPLAFNQPALSLGNVQVGQGKTIRRQIEVRNITDQNVSVSAKGIGGELMQVQAAGELSLAAGKTGTLSVLINIKASTSEQAVIELNGAVEITTKAADQTFKQLVPVLAMLTKISDIQATTLNVFASSQNDAADAHAELTLVNRGTQAGLALPFNLIGTDRRKPQPDVTDSFRSRSCDLESAGYRIVRKEVDGELQDMLQFAVKIFEPVTTWHYCEISVQIDSNNDQLADQELVGINGANLAGLGGLGFSSLLLDAVKARSIRLTFEKELGSGKEEQLNYAESVQDLQPMRVFENSTLAVVETPLKLVGLRPGGELAVKIAALYSDTEGLAPDDFLGGQLKSWKRLNAQASSNGFYNLPETIQLAAGATETVALNRGAGQENLVVYFPTNRSARSVKSDPQAQEVKATYQQLTNP
ncbi:MAG: S8 family serine peptidase [Bdellovibrionales bacterium]